jgi:peptidoglycan-associated lipoprotein
MFKKIVSISALTLALAACESTGEHEGLAEESYEGQIVPGSNEDFAQNAGDRIFFATNSSFLTGESKATISKQAEWLKTYNTAAVTVEGHCDERGTSEYNLALGERRANADRGELTRSGISSDRMSTVSYGKERPAAEGHDEAAWSQNRRAVTVVNQ